MVAGKQASTACGSIKAAALGVSLVRNALLAATALPGGSQVEAGRLHWLARLLGEVCTAFPVAFVGASLIDILSGARPSIPAHRSVARLADTVTSVPSQLLPVLQSWPLRHAQPRASPISVATLV